MAHFSPGDGSPRRHPLGVPAINFPFRHSPGRACAYPMRMSPAHTSCACTLRIPIPRPHAAPCSGQVIGHVNDSYRRDARRAPSSSNRSLREARSSSAHPTHERGARATRNQCDYKFLRNTLTSDINITRSVLRRSASRAQIAVIPLQNRSVTVQRVARIVAMSVSAAVAEQRHSQSPQLHSNGKFGAVARGEDGGTCPPESHRLSRHPESTTQRGLV